MKWTKIAMCVLAFLPLSAGSAGADILWDQMALEGSAFVSTTAFGRRAYDDFSLTGSFRITNLAWNGGSHIEPGPVVPGFNIDVYDSIYDDNLGRYTPGANLYHQYVPIEQITLGDLLPGTGYREHSADISSNPFNASADVSYWLSIQATGSEWWGWHLSSTNNLNVALFGSSYQPITDYDPEYHDFAFQLEGSPVPIPAAVWLLGSGILGAGLIRRRLRRVS